MHALIAPVLLASLSCDSWRCDGHLEDHGPDILIPVPNGFMINSTLYYRTATGGWMWDTGYIHPMPNGGAIGWGWDTLPRGVAFMPEPRPYRHGALDVRPTPLAPGIRVPGMHPTLAPRW